MKQLLKFSIITGFLYHGILLAPCTVNGQSETVKSTLFSDVQSLMAEMTFGDLVFEVTGRKIIPYDKELTWQRDTIFFLSNVANEVLGKMNAFNSPIRKRRRINEVSRDFENALLKALAQSPDWTCEIPVNASGKRQRAGYPDLLLTHKSSGRRIYLDPKVYGYHQSQSSLRTFYYEPRPKTSKILYDAMHLLIGFEHDGSGVGKWKFSKWTIVDLAHVDVRLKLEFQTSNREMYQTKNILAEKETLSQSITN